MQPQKEVPDKLHSFALMVGRIDSTLGGLFVSYLATNDRLSRLWDLKWYREDLDRYENKVRMKEVGAAGMQYKFFLKQSAILTLAKAIEDCLIDYQREIGQALKFWKIANNFVHGQHAKEVRSLANIIKHNQSVIVATSSSDAKYLVTDQGYLDNVTLEYLMLQDARAFDIPTTIENVYCFLMELVEKGTGYRHPILNLENDERTNTLRQHLVPSVLEL